MNYAYQCVCKLVALARSQRCSTTVCVLSKEGAMNRFIFLAASVAMVGGLAAFTASAGGGDGEHKHHEMFSKCAKACADCQRHCDWCFHHCAKLVENGKKEHAKSMNLCLDCGELCSTTARLTGRHSPLSGTVCDACAKACDVCAESCEKVSSDKHMAACAKSCRDCAKECREMIKHLRN